MAFWEFNLDSKLKEAEREIEYLKLYSRRLALFARNRAEFLHEHGESVRTIQALVYIDQLLSDLDPRSIGVNAESGRKIIWDIKHAVRTALRCARVRSEEFEFPDRDSRAKADIEAAIMAILKSIEPKENTCEAKQKEEQESGGKP